MDGNNPFNGTNWTFTTLIISLLVIWCAGGALIVWAMWHDQAPQEKETDDEC